MAVAHNGAVVMDAQALREVLIQNCRLTEEDIERIEIEMLSLDVDFGEAAVALGLASSEELLHAHEQVARDGPQHGAPTTLVALQPTVRDGALVLHHGPPIRRSAEFVATGDMSSDRGEQLRQLRTELMLQFQGQRGNAIAILSCAPGEGRTRLVADLAVAFAQLGVETLLVDADFRSPGQHRLFMSEDPWGWMSPSGVIGSVQVRPVEDVPHLSVIAASEPVPQAIDLVSGPFFENVLDQWRQNYDLVLVDTPAAGKYADAIAIAQAVGTALLVARSDSSSLQDLRSLTKRLATTRAEVVGAVLNHF